jgi:DNA-binding PadR family transcriptional regulator
MTISESGDRRSNRTRYIVLGILARGPASGYDVACAVRDSTGYFWSEGFGQIYPSMKQLAAEGLIRPCNAPVQPNGKAKESRRRKTLFELTPEGEKFLDTWLAEPYQPAVERNEMLLKIFFSARLNADIATRHFMQAIQEAQAAARVLTTLEEELVARLPDPAARFFYEATIRYGQKAAQAQEEWSREMMQGLKGVIKSPKRQ